MITLTIAEIRELADCAGLILDNSFVPDKEQLDMEITIMTCPAEGVKTNEGTTVHCRHLIYFPNSPEDGMHPIGQTVVQGSAPDIQSSVE